ncbi:MAG: MFS transporter, partial [Actinomycetota bacterium]
MYLSRRSAAHEVEAPTPVPDQAPGAEPEGAPPAAGEERPSTTRGLSRLLVAPNVFFLGMTSFTTDVSSEMVAAVLPLFLTVRLGFTALQFGATDGALGVITSVAGLITALMADRWRRYREMAGAGYAVSAASRIGLVTARTWFPILGWLSADKVGKGVRTGPRDALISLSAPEGRMGEAFGLHRMLDTGGALGGPLLAVLLLTVAPGSYTTVFVAAFFIALIGLSIIGLLVRNLGSRRAGSPLGRLTSPLAELWSHRRFRRLALATALLSLPAISDSFLFLTLNTRIVMSQKWFPALFFAESMIYLLFAVPFGRLADRLGAGRVLLAGQAALGASYVLLLVTGDRLALLIGVPLLLGIFFAATSGVLAALASHVVPTSSRTTGLAVIGVIVAGGGALAEMGFGAVWLERGSHEALAAATAVLIALGLLAVVVLRPLLRTGSAGEPPASPPPPPAGGGGRPVGGGCEGAPRAGREPVVSGAFASAVGAGGSPSPGADAGHGAWGSPRRNLVGRVGVVVAVAVVCIGATTAYTAHSAHAISVAGGRSSASLAIARAQSTRGQGAARSTSSTPAPLTASLPALLAEPHLLVLDTSEGPDFDRLEVASQSDPSGPRAPTPLSCDRVDEAGDRGLCLTYNTTTQEGGITVFNQAFSPLWTLT